MADFTPILVVIWVVVMLGVFPSFTPHRGILFIVLGGTLFLPQLRAEIALGPLHFNKFHAISYAALFSALMYDSERVLSWRPQWFDTAALIWCLCPLPSVMTNDPPPDGSSSLRDAFAQTWGQIASYGIPYLLGRVYFTERAKLRDLALGVVLAAAVYAPLCLYEARMSPQLHARVFGYAQHDFAQTIRFGGYRPMVFLPHGLAVAMFMTSGTLIACWMWWSGGLRSPVGEGGEVNKRLEVLPFLLGPTTVMLKSTGALGLGLVGGAVLVLGRLTGLRVWLVALALLPPVYVAVRATGTWSGESLVTAVGENIEEDRARSLEFRFINEDLLVAKALERPLFGWGGWGRNRVYDEETGGDSSTTDGLWIIVLGDRGLVGLIALGGVLLIPVVRFAYLFPAATWSTRSVAPVAACAVVVALWTIDCLPNGMVLPIYVMMAGAISGADPAEFAEPDGEPQPRSH
ncbi:O-antigen ligase domain-containing protein [Frigoriglobus tundricola]|uniref:O-antigen ligase domain-containing protein n=1 Tax=Frigoriglobus tundricola TaxID=2774151 RepID=A0A6M5YHG8_9BACT|nr:O-antigen ligase domain-containing protein [Frigoriglobus tundricola]QJW92703.1 hypothetical protein FTUN_0200 [Frigoriglobus tundricola]